MAYCSYHNGELTVTRGKVLGSFKHKDSGILFEYVENLEFGSGFGRAFPHKLAVLDGKEFRYAKVLTTVAYVVVDEECGEVVVEKWQLKGKREYA